MRNPDTRNYRWLETILFAYFCLRLIFFAASISPFVPPDEVTHFGLSRIFSSALFMPNNSSDTYQYGLVTNIPWLYYWVMGKLLSFNFFGLPDLLFLRLLNIPIAVTTVIYVKKLLGLLTQERSTHLLLLVAVTNTLMFSFLSASVSYDNLTNLLAAMSIYYLISFQIKREGGYLVKSILCQLCGCLTKTSFLPLAAILTVLLIGLEIKNLRVTARSIKSYIQTKTISAAGLVITTAIALLLNIQLYGGNYYKYSSIAPEMQQVISTEAAMQNRIAARNIIFSLFRDGKISLEEAESMASRIKHPTDRTDAVNLVNNYADFFSSGAAAIGPASYIGWWIPLMAGSIFGIKAHLGMANRFDIVFALLMLLSIVSFFFRCRETINRLLASMLIIALSYTGFIYFTVNYDSYLHFKDVMASVSGRYCFPVLGPIYILATFYLLRLFRNTTVRGIIAVSVAVLFISLDFPYFLAHATPEWYSEPFSSSFLVALFR